MSRPIRDAARFAQQKKLITKAIQEFDRRGKRVPGYVRDAAKITGAGQAGGKWYKKAFSWAKKAHDWVKKNHVISRGLDLAREAGISIPHTRLETVARLKGYGQRGNPTVHADIEKALSDQLFKELSAAENKAEERAAEAKFLRRSMKNKYNPKEKNNRPESVGKIKQNRGSAVKLTPEDRLAALQRGEGARGKARLPRQVTLASNAMSSRRVF